MTKYAELRPVPLAFRCLVLTLCLFALHLLLSSNLQAGSPSPGAADLIAKMSAAYSRLTAYQTEVETNEYDRGRVVGTRRFRYSFKKPHQVRIDMETPHPGMRLVYPDEKGKVSVRFGGWKAFLKLHLAPDNVLLRTRSGQRIDQSDFGLLIQNIGHSLTDRRRGEFRLSEGADRLLLDVLAEDHFLVGEVTRYRFIIDKSHWLPVEIREYTPDGLLKRTVNFHKLQTAPDLPDRFFLIDEEDSAHGQADR